MKIENIEKYFKVNPGAYYYKDGKQYWQSVHYGSYNRYNTAKEQIKKPTVEIEVIINYINEFLETINIATVENPIMKPDKIDYGVIKTQFNLDDIRDLIWLKFTKDKYVGVVATSNDINFDIPPDALSYDLRDKEGWKYNSAGILLHKLNKTWDESFVLVFPLKNLSKSCKYTRHQIEIGVGNYLTEQDVPIIDFFSHNIG